eukprot:TRINITY_DN3885_c0_g1_i3.p1 TRINITY_DN3885_c0_g1~~TRINITY_DN3885_c0_g1_i3.p1  ORF type:complete len:299 (+),score=52.91 TRINITY_DN3885_c0_g1_i3:102-998(+)
MLRRQGLSLCLAISALGADAQLAVPTKTIAAGVEMPVVAIGTGGLESQDASTIVSNWMSIGGRGVDTANVYRDQDVVGQAIRASGVSRKDVFITTKIPGCFAAETFVNKSLRELNTDYIDLMLIHFPGCPSWMSAMCKTVHIDCPATWATLEKYHAQGVLRAIGISNFGSKDLEPVVAKATVLPAVNQIEFNVLEWDDDMLQASKRHNITVEAYSPLGRANHSGDILGNAVIKDVAQKHNVSSYQVALKWILKHGHILTFQSTSKEHQSEDADLFSFDLSDDEMTRLDGLHKPSTIVV